MMMAIPALVGGGLALYNALSNKGEVTERAKPYEPNENRFGLGYNIPGSKAEDIAKGYEKQGATYNNRPFVQANEQNFNQSRTEQEGTRGESYAALENLQQAASGNAPSAAMAAMQLGQERAIANQMGAAASTRGGGLQMAAAQRQAAMQGAQMQMHTIAQGAQMRAEEMERARQAYMQGALGMRGQDIGRMGTEGQFALGQGQLALGSQAQNQQAQLAYAGLAAQTREQERQAMMALEGMHASQYGSAQSQNLAIAQYNTQMQQQKWNAMTGALMSGASAGLSMMGGGGAAGGAGAAGGSAAANAGANAGAMAGGIAGGGGGRPY